MKGPCFKKQVKATLVAYNGKRYVGTNECDDAQDYCPRNAEGYPAGEGYHLCRLVCKQTAHAEVHALAAAGDNAAGSTMYIEGIDWVCGDCKAACAEALVKEVIIGSPP